MTQSFNDLFASYETERLQEIEKEEIRYNSPEEVAKREARRKAVFELGLREGWHDEAGNSLLPEDDEEDDLDED